MLQVASLAHPHLPGSNSHSGQQSHGTDRTLSHAHASGVNVRALMSHLRHGSSSWGPAAMPGSSGSSASSYADVRLASARAGDVAGGISANGNMVRRRRLASEDLDNPWDSSSSTAPESSSHPLAGPSRSLHASAAQSRRGSDATAEASRPALTRLTSETEREVEAAGIASRSSTDGGSLRGSFDLLRTALKPAGEVEVLVHQVKPTESLQGIALQYGIDLPVLRKINKLWASDPVSLRRELYVPLDACRWTKTSQTVVRGPEEGQITLVTRKLQPRNTKGKGKQRESILDDPESDVSALDSPPDETLSIEGLPSSAEIPLALRSLLADGQHTARVHRVVRVAAADLAFFPKTSAKDRPGRQSLDTYFASDHRPTIPRSPSSTDTLSAAAVLASSQPNGRARPFVTVGAFRKPFSPPTMTPTGRSAIPDVRAPSGRVTRSSSNPAMSGGSVHLGQLSSGITSKLSSLFIGPNSPADSSRASTDSTPRTAGMSEAPYELVVRSPSAVRPEAQSTDWSSSGGGGPNSSKMGTRNATHLGQVKTTQPMRSPAMSVPGKVADLHHIDLGK